MSETYADYKYKKIKRFLESEFIPRYIQMKRFKGDNKEIILKPSIQLYNIALLNYDDETLKYVFNYLNRVEVLVEGQEPTFFLKNFDYVLDYKKNKSPRNHVNNDDELLNEYLKTNDNKIRDVIIMNNIGIVKYLSYRFSKKTNLNIEEIESYGYEGLMKAINSYNKDAHSSFCIFAHTCIRNAIINGIPKIYGFKAGNFYESFRASKEKIEQLSGTIIEEDYDLIFEIVEDMLKTTSHHYRNETKNHVFIEFPESLEHINENIVSEDKSFLIDIEKENIYENLIGVLEKLPFKEQEIIKYLYGFKDGRTYTLEEVGNIFGVSRERIRTIHANALKHLRHPKNSRYLRIENNDLNENYPEGNIICGRKL